MDFVKLTNDKLSVESITELVVEESCGAVSVFIGTTRDIFDGNTVTHLEYEAYEPMAVKTIKNVCADIRKQWQTVRNVAIYHRLGSVPVKEASIVIAISAPHRNEAMQATQFCIDAIKKSVPIWKKEIYKDQQSQWKENKESNNAYPPRIKLFKSHLESNVDVSSIHPSLIQIKASNEEVQRRVETFLKRKRNEINESNVRDFCGQVFGKEEEFSCSRVDAKLRRTKNSKSHLEINRAYNRNWRDRTNFDYMNEHIPSNGIDERLLNMETQLSLKSAVPLRYYTRLKNVEDRLMLLESLSPEYIKFWENGSLNGRINGKKRVYSVDDLDYLITQMEKKKTDDV